MNNSNGIDPSTGLPDLSLLGDDLYWEISKDSKYVEDAPDTYSIKIMQNVLVSKKGFFRGAKYSSQTVGKKTLSRYKSFNELTPEVVSKLSKFIESYSYRFNVDATARELFEKTSKKFLVIKSVNLSHRIYWEDLVEYNLSDDLVQLCALDVYHEVLEDKTKALKKELQTRANDKFLGMYPPNKLGDEK